MAGCAGHHTFAKVIALLTRGSAAATRWRKKRGEFHSPRRGALSILLPEKQTLQEQGQIVADFRDLTEEQAHWLRRVLQTRPKRGGLDVFTIPDDVHDALIEKGLIRWVHGQVEISLEGIRAISRYRPQEAD
jgi:hypothetical protein